MLTLPLFILLAAMTALAVGLWLSALNVQYRDVQHLILPHPGLDVRFAGRLFHPAHPRRSFPCLLYGLNPMAGVIQGFRWALLGTEPPGAPFAVSVAIVLVLLVSGLAYFRKMEDSLPISFEQIPLEHSL